MDYVVTTWLVQSSACSCPWSSLSHCPTGPPMTATGQSTKAARRTGRQEPRTGGAMQGPLVKYPLEVLCKCSVCWLKFVPISYFRDESVDSFVFPAWQPDTWTSFCMMADKGNRTFKGGDLQPTGAPILYFTFRLHWMVSPCTTPPATRVATRRGSWWPCLVMRSGTGQPVAPSRICISGPGSSQIKVHCTICTFYLFWSLHDHLSEMQDYSNCKTVAGGDLFSWDTAKLTLQDPTDIVIKSVSYYSHL